MWNKCHCQRVQFVFSKISLNTLTLHHTKWHRKSRFLKKIKGFWKTSANIWNHINTNSCFINGWHRGWLRTWTGLREREEIERKWCCVSYEPKRGRERQHRRTNGHDGEPKQKSAVICIRSHTGRKQKVHYSAKAIEQAKARRWAIMLNYVSFFEYSNWF